MWTNFSCHYRQIEGIFIYIILSVDCKMSQEIEPAYESVQDSGLVDSDEEMPVAASNVNDNEESAVEEDKSNDIESSSNNKKKREREVSDDEDGSKEDARKDENGDDSHQNNKSDNKDGVAEGDGDGGSQEDDEEDNEDDGKKRKKKKKKRTPEEEAAREERKRLKREKKERKRRKKEEKKARKALENDDDDDDDDDDSEEEADDVDSDPEEESGEAIHDKKKKKKPKSRKDRKTDISRYFADAAESGDEEEEEDEGDYEDADIVYDEHEAAAIAAVEERHRVNRDLHSKGAMDIADDIVNRYKSTARVHRSAAQYGQGQGVFRPGDIRQQTALPSGKDPHIWRLRCKQGDEIQAVRSIMCKQQALKESGKTIGINSCFSTSSKGYIYIEAVAEPLARQAIQNLRSVWGGTMTLVGVQSRTSLLSFTSTKKPLKEGQWCRLRRGPLKGDLAKVLRVIEGGDMALIQAVPRPDYYGMGKQSGTRPAQALFNIEEARKANYELERRRLPHTGEFLDCHNNDFYKKGFLVKEVSVNTWLNSNSVQPRLEELQLFRNTDDGPEEDDLDADDASDDASDDSEGNKKEKSANKINKSSKSVATTVGGMMRDLADVVATDTNIDDTLEPSMPYIIGDLVQVVEGELTNLVGRVTNINDRTNLIDIQPIQLNSNLPVQRMGVTSLVKYIQPGAHVKVKEGPNMGQTGRVVSVMLASDGSRVAAILTDNVNSEIRCNVDHLVQTSEVANTLSNLQGYEVYDLVVINLNEAAVVTSVGPEYLTVINHQGEIKRVLPQELKGKRNVQSERASTFDAAHSSITVGDTVNVTEGAHGKQSGTVRHMWKSILYLHNKNYLKNAGMFVCRSRQCLLAGSKGKSLVSGLGNANNSRQQPQPIIGRRSFATEHVGKMVRIRKGSYKALVGCIYEADDTHYGLELLAQNKKIRIERTKCVFEESRKPSDASSYAAATTPMLMGETPMLTGAETPMLGGAETPMHTGAETPSYDPFRPDYAAPGTSSVGAYGAGGGSAYGAPGYGSAYGQSSTYSGGTYDPSSVGSYSGGVGQSSLTPSSLQYSPNSQSSPAGETLVVSDVPSQDWMRDTLLVSTDNRLFCMQSQSIESNGDVIVCAIINNQMGYTESMHYSELQTLKPTRGSKVRLVESRRSHDVHVVKSIVDNDVILKGMASEFFNINQMVCVFEY